MSESAYIYVIGPLVAGAIGGISYIFKKWLETRDRRREEIETRLEHAENRQERTDKKLNSLVSIVISCDNPNCPTRPKVAKWLNEINEHDND